MKKLKRTILTFTALSLLCYAPVASAETEPPSINAESAFVINANSGEIIYEKNADIQLPTASLTKLMTLYLASESIQSGDLKKKESIKISENAWRTEGSKMWLEVNRSVKVDDLLKGLIVASGNDAAVVLAERMSGNTENFVKDMNNKAKALKLKNTTFHSPHGLSKQDVSTARDLASLSTAYISKFPENIPLHSLKDFKFDTGRNIAEHHTHNSLLGVYNGLDGLSTGMINGNWNMIATAKKGNLRLIAVVLNAKGEKKRNSDITSLLNYSFNQYTTFSFGEKDEAIDSLTVYKSKTRKIDLVLKNDLSIIDLNKYEGTESIIDDIPSYLVGDFEKGEKVGERIVTMNNKTYKADITVAESTIESHSIWTVFDNVAIMFRNLLGKIL